MFKQHCVVQVGITPYIPVILSRIYATSLNTDKKRKLMQHHTTHDKMECDDWSWVNLATTYSDEFSVLLKVVAKSTQVSITTVYFVTCCVMLHQS